MLTTSFLTVNFWHTMLCISVALAYAIVQCLIVTFVYSDETSKHIFKIFSPSGSHTILVFPYQTSCQYSDVEPLMGALNAGAVGKNRDSRQISGYRIDDW